MNKIVVITGASGGLGKSLVTEFAANAWRVIGTGRSEQPDDLPQGVLYKQFDASNATACELFWQQIKQQYPGTEVCLVNNADAYVSGGLTETKVEDYDQQMKSSYFTAVYMTRYLALNFPKARIINVISSSALAAHKNNSAYGAAKAATMHFFQSLQRELKPEQYQITNLYPFNIASHGPADNAMSPQDVSAFIREQAENDRTYYLRDVTIWPR
ncbi:MAG TPA: SDR family NAD(P)-dependent oxidoreductase [Candidatus Saccharimonadales bacterium]|nr:SDR family NAD(P)-dependent oxidoreductase [Candidatus Saccharimonadales bacterium]